MEGEELCMCPKCKGYGEVMGSDNPYTIYIDLDACPLCKGTGAVPEWKLDE